MRAPRLSHSDHSRRGGVTPLTVLSISLLLGMVAVAVDGGTLMQERRHVQASADAAALAAAAELYTHYPANRGTDPAPHSAQAAALTNALANGFTNDGIQSSVSVTFSPNNYQGGPNVGKPVPAGYVEVIIQYNVDRTFSNIFGTGAVPVRARAVARGIGAPVGYNLVLLTLRATPALIINGSGNLKVNGAVYVNTSYSSAIQLNGGGTILAPVFDLVGAVGGLLGWLLGLLGLDGKSTSPTAVQPIPDPLRYLSAPDTTTLSAATTPTNLVITSGTVDLYPGIYTGGIIIKGGTVTLHANGDGTPGIYYLQGGGFSVSRNATVTSDSAGVMIYNAWQSVTDIISISTSAAVTLQPPTTGPYRGISLFQAPGTLALIEANAVPALTLIGNSSGTTSIGGAIYAAYAPVNLSSKNSGNFLCGQLVADTLTVSGSYQVTIDPNGQLIANGRSIGLVE